MISTAVPTGVVQVPPAGQPILLMADHAPTGGYAVAATVISADLPLAGQLAPGDWVEFRVCTLEEADAALRDREAALGSR
jgi:antagonist of KipI